MSKDVAYYLDNPDELPDDPTALAKLALEGTVDDEGDDDKTKTADAEQTADKAAQGDKGKVVEGQEKGNEDEHAEGVLGRDGKTVIPYGVLKGAREEAASLRRELEELRAQKPVVLPPAAADSQDDAKAEPTQDDKIEATFKEMYGYSQADFIEEFGEAQAKVLLGPVKHNVIMKDEIDSLKKDRETRVLTEEEQAIQAMQDAIDANPTLSNWQQNDPEKWEDAKTWDIAISNNPKYAHLSLGERFNLVVEKINGKKADEQPSKKTTIDEKAEEALRNAEKRAAVPTSLSSFPAGGDPAAQTELEALEKASVADLERLMTDPKRQAEILANL